MLPALTTSASFPFCALASLIPRFINKKILTLISRDYADDDNIAVHHASAGCDHVVAVLSDKSVVGWGSSRHGQGGRRVSSSTASNLHVHAAHAVGLLEDVVAVAAGGDFSAVLCSDGQVGLLTACFSSFVYNVLSCLGVGLGPGKLRRAGLQRCE
jgi:alpha-tubulin suppressor-like RCC1 family protein